MKSNPVFLRSEAVWNCTASGLFLVIASKMILIFLKEAEAK